MVAQVDSAIGGKTGVNLDKVKNQVGAFYPPESVFICPGFLRTLPAGHFRSGLAEIIKSMLLDNPAYWRKIKKIPVAGLMEQSYDSRLVSEMTALSVKYKTRLVSRDFRETNIRKALNFGHTIGHAFESFCMKQGHDTLLHGDAVAAGMVCAVWLSARKCGLAGEVMNEVTAYLLNGFARVEFSEKDIPDLINLMKFDKKNMAGQLRFTLISAPGKPCINVACTPQEAGESLLFYLQQKQLTGL